MELAGITCIPHIVLLRVRSLGSLSPSTNFLVTLGLTPIFSIVSGVSIEDEKGSRIEGGRSADCSLGFHLGRKRSKTGDPRKC